jgi:hypothetical protein
MMETGESFVLHDLLQRHGISGVLAEIEKYCSMGEERLRDPAALVTEEFPREMRSELADRLQKWRTAIAIARLCVS